MNKVLIANRGEIALRVIRTCHEMGISTVAVYSTADRDSLPVRFAGEAVCIGPPPSSESYLRFERIIASAEVTGADAIHPGYGFLAENAEFARVCGDHGLKFIGPAPETITRMGDKSLAKITMREAGVPTVPDSNGIVKSLSDARRAADAIGYPVIVKASAGGGGRGMRIAETEKDLARSYETARVEAKAGFGNADVYIEKYILHPHHIEMQILGDGRGGVVHLGERDCSIQRRHQKLIEESPSPAVDAALRDQLGNAALRAAEAVHYEGAGTVEFLLDQQGDFYFMEMNTRIQVEHPVTEEVSDTDLIEWQLRIAMGEELTLGTPALTGHALECRINAEDPTNGFRPCPGKITAFHIPKGRGVRVDTAACAGYVVPPYYDSLIAKVIVHAKTRELAVSKMARSLDEFIIEGIQTTIPIHKQIIADEQFRSGAFDTHFMEHFNPIVEIPEEIQN